MGFADEIRQWTEKVKAREQAVFDGVVQALHASIVEGSTVTGSPGQPVAIDGHGELKESWEVVRESPDVAVIATDVEYAPEIELGVRQGKALTLRAPVGGFHSVALTVAGFDKVVADVVKEVAGA